MDEYMYYLTSRISARIERISSLNKSLIVACNSDENEWSRKQSIIDDIAKAAIELSILEEAKTIYESFK